MPPLAKRAVEIKRLHELGYRFRWPPRIGDLTQRQRQLLSLAYRAEQYRRQEQRKRKEADTTSADRPDHFGNVGESRRSAFQ